MEPTARAVAHVHVCTCARAPPLPPAARRTFIRTSRTIPIATLLARTLDVDIALRVCLFRVYARACAASTSQTRSTKVRVRHDRLLRAQRQHVPERSRGERRQGALREARRRQRRGRVRDARRAQPRVPLYPKTLKMFHFKCSYLNGIRIFLHRNWFQCRLVRSTNPKKTTPVRNI